MSDEKNKGGRPPKYEDPAKKRGLTATDEGWDGLGLLARRFKMSRSEFINSIGSKKFHIVLDNEETDTLFQSFGASNLSELLEKISSEDTLLIPPKLKKQITDIAKTMDVSSQEVALECLKIALKNPENIQKALFDQKVKKFTKLAEDIFQKIDLVEDTSNISPEALELLKQISNNEMDYR